ncbi:SET domain-containing protein 9 [Trichinella papuae]|uniref:SET domain-containing protein 9 n=1 Tax=Trichinella papuae TaxID=268474 RepID=A0A0V1MUI3_9BILA|nr:SET domain-containing protein 9 [Trichinella papuae]
MVRILLRTADGDLSAIYLLQHFLLATVEAIALRRSRLVSRFNEMTIQRMELLRQSLPFGRCIWSAKPKRKQLNENDTPPIATTRRWNANGKARDDKVLVEDLANCNVIQELHTQAKVDDSTFVDRILTLFHLLQNKITDKFETFGTDKLQQAAEEAIYETFGFNIKRFNESVFVNKGKINPNQIVCIYPGTVYSPQQTRLCTSCNKKYVYMCQDGTLVDANDTGVARLIYKSCTYRDRHSDSFYNDMTWMSSSPVNPLAVGQYVEYDYNDVNVQAKELDLELNNVEGRLRKFLPILRYFNSSNRNKQNNVIRVVVFISTKTISCGEKLKCAFKTS